MNAITISVLIERTCLLTGRILIGLYFIIPAIGKIADFEGTSEYMGAHDVPMIPVLLVITIVIQISAGLALIVGFKAKLAAFLLAGLTLVISLYMHNFWAYEAGLEKAHEVQNFFKNMGIMAGLLIVAGIGSGPLSLDNRSQSD
jgi:putative oxidoreductase